MPSGLKLLRLLIQEAIPRGVTSAIRQWEPPQYKRSTTPARWGPEMEDQGEDEPSWMDGLPEAIVNVIHKHISKNQMRFLGRGSSRTVFSIGGGRVLKVAFNNAGVAQNEEEKRLSKGPLKEITARVYRADPEGKWLIMEEVSPSSRAEELLQFDGRILDPESSPDEEDNGEYLRPLQDWENLSSKDQDAVIAAGGLGPEQLRLMTALERAGVLNADSLAPYHWGETKDGRIVLMDFGYSDSTKHFYR